MYYARSTGMAFLYYKLLTDRLKTQKNQLNDTFLAVFRLLSIHAVTTHNLWFHWNVYSLNTFRSVDPATTLRGSPTPHLGQIGSSSGFMGKIGGGVTLGVRQCLGHKARRVPHNA